MRFHTIVIVLCKNENPVRPRILELSETRLPPASQPTLLTESVRTGAPSMSKETSRTL